MKCDEYRDERRLFSIVGFGAAFFLSVLIGALLVAIFLITK